MHNCHHCFDDGHHHHHRHHWDRAQHCGKVDRSRIGWNNLFDEEFLKQIVREMVKEYFEKKENNAVEADAETTANKPKKHQHFGWTYGPCNLEQAGRNDENHEVSRGWHQSAEMRQNKHEQGRSDEEESFTSNDEGKKLHKEGKKWGCGHHHHHGQHEGRSRHHGRIYPNSEPFMYPHRGWGFGMNPGFAPWMMHPRRLCGPPICCKSERKCGKFCSVNSTEDNAEKTENSSKVSESKDSNGENMMMETVADEAPIPSVSLIEEVVDNLKKSNLNAE